MEEKTSSGAVWKAIVTLVVTFSTITAAFAVINYFAFYLPGVESEKIQVERDREDAKITKEIQDNCLPLGKKYYKEFSIENTSVSPFFFQDKDITSISKNDELVNSIDAYINCMTSDPRANLESNNSLVKIHDNAREGLSKIREHILDSLRDDRKLCDSITYKNVVDRYCKEFDK